MSHGDRVGVSRAEFQAFFDTLSRWGRWGKHDERGALHFLTPERVAAAAALVRSGVTVSMSLPLNTRPGPHNPKPTEHHMTELADSDPGSEAERFNKDYVGADYHHDGHTHIDALCHVAYGESLYNGRSAVEAVTEDGARVESIATLKDGLVGRGVLLDIPRLQGRKWLEPGEHVFTEDLLAAEERQEVAVRSGDIMLVRTGHNRRLAELGPWDTGRAKAGLHPSTMPFVAEREVSALGCDSNSDTAPSSTEGVGFPIHVLAIAAMGVHLLDYLQLDELAAGCERTGRWEFMFVAVPLLITGGTGSPLNPIALF
jgi:kynurenine formamidase